MQYVSLESYMLSEYTLLTHKSKYHNDIQLVSLNVLGC